MLNIENNGQKFSEKKLLEGQNLLTSCLRRIAQEISPGMTEMDASEKAKIELNKSGFGKNWHPPKIRFGPNTLKTFSEISEPGIVLKPDDIFFFDLGPILAEHECDYGETFAVGNNPELQRLRDSSKILFDQVKKKWKQNNLSGQKLYDYAQTEAKKMGYDFITEGASGHRVGDFPHQVHYRGSLIEIEKPAAPNRWILEIQIHDKKIHRGAFFEDIL